jgi:hypothetical protein
MLARADPYSGIARQARQGRAATDLVRLLKRKFQQNFDKLKLESVTYKREREERRHLKIIPKIIQLENIIKRKLLLNKMHALQQMR